MLKTSFKKLALIMLCLNCANVQPGLSQLAEAWTSLFSQARQRFTHLPKRLNKKRHRNVMYAALGTTTAAVLAAIIICKRRSRANQGTVGSRAPEVPSTRPPQTTSEAARFAGDAAAARHLTAQIAAVKCSACDNTRQFNYHGTVMVCQFCKPTLEHIAMNFGPAAERRRAAATYETHQSTL